MALIGYYSMIGGAGTAAMADDIVAAGHTPVLLDGTNWHMLDQIDTLYVWNGDNLSYNTNFVSHMPQITQAVQNGMDMVVFDRAIGEINPQTGQPLNPSVVLPGAGGLQIQRYLSADADLTDAGQQMIGSGPAPGINDTSLDGGNYTTHGYALTSSLPPGATVLMTPHDGINDQAVGFVYEFGAGMVQYYGIPMDFYNFEQAGWSSNWQNFAINTLVASTICLEETVPVLTGRGLRAAGSLEPGEMIATLDHGLQPLVWLDRDPEPREVLELPPGRFGNRLPLRMTAQHRVLFASPLAELAFGASELLMPAAALAAAGVAHPAGQGRVCNLLLPRHEIILAAGGAPVESLLPTPAVLRALGRAGRRAAGPAARGKLRPARPLLSVQEGAALLRWLAARDDGDNIGEIGPRASMLRRI